jgi:GNAT superfamily N-acetyltransferase
MNESFRKFVESSDNELENLVKSLELRYPGLILFVSRKNNEIHIHEIKVPEGMRGQGIGSQVIREIQNYAKSLKLPVTLIPEPEARYKAKLLKFYKDLGFYPNSGRRRDYSIGSTFGKTWVWRPF